MAPPRIPPAVRFAQYVNKDGDCWLWTGQIEKFGYGKFRADPKRPAVPAHRFAYEQANGPVPAHLKVCHHCDSPACVRPTHLYAATQAENIADKVSRGRQAKGETHGMAKLSAATVRRMRRELSRGARAVDIAKKYGLSRTTTGRILRGLLWREAGGPIAATIQRRWRP